MTANAAGQTELRCLLIGFEGGGGEERFVRDLATRPPPGVDYTWVNRHHQSAPGARARRVTEVAFNRLVNPFLRPLHGLKAYDVDERFDLVHVHQFPHRIRSARDAPIVMTCSSSYVHYIRDYLGWPEPKIDALYRRAQRVFRALRISSELTTPERISGIAVFSGWARDVLVSRGVPGELLVVIPPGFDTPRLPERPDNGHFTFLFAGRAPQRKGADLVIDGVRRLRAAGAKVECVLAGDESFVELRGEDGFEVHGVVSRDYWLEELYPRADAFVMPSRAEGYGFAPIEAMSFGLPVITSRYGALPEIVDDEVTGLLVPPGDGESVHAAMRRLAGDPALARAMGQAGRRRFEDRFSRERFLAEMRAWYERVLGAA